MASIPIERPEPSEERPQNLCLDAAYDAPAVHAHVQALGFVPHICSRGEERQQKRLNPEWRARRWVVEGTHSWLNRTDRS